MYACVRTPFIYLPSILYAIIYSEHEFSSVHQSKKFKGRILSKLDAIVGFHM